MVLRRLVGKGSSSQVEGWLHVMSFDILLSVGVSEESDALMTRGHRWACRTVSMCGNLIPLLGGTIT